MTERLVFLLVIGAGLIAGIAADLNPEDMGEDERMLECMHIVFCGEKWLEFDKCKPILGDEEYSNELVKACAMHMKQNFTTDKEVVDHYCLMTAEQRDEIQFTMVQHFLDMFTTGCRNGDDKKCRNFSDYFECAVEIPLKMMEDNEC